MTIIELIKREHDEVADLFDHLAVLARHGRRREEAARVAARLVAVVRVHSMAEERVLYEALRSGPPPLRAFALAGPHEHELLDTTLDKLLVRRANEEEYGAIVKVARDLFESHARAEEEGQILPLVQRSLSEPELVTLATDMVATETQVRLQVMRICGMARAA